MNLATTIAEIEAQPNEESQRERALKARDAWLRKVRKKYASCRSNRQHPKRVGQRWQTSNSYFLCQVAECRDCPRTYRQLIFSDTLKPASRPFAMDYPDLYLFPPGLSKYLRDEDMPTSADFDDVKVLKAPPAGLSETELDGIEHQVAVAAEAA